MKQEFISKVLIGCSLAALASSVFSEDVRKYTVTESTGSVRSSHTWTIQHTVKGIEIRWISSDKSFFSLCDEDGNTVEWHLRDATEDITARRFDNLIAFAGSRAGKKFYKDISIDKSPWFQPIPYALGRFSQSRLDTVVFWAIRPDNLDVVKLLAKRDGEDRITTRTGPLLARKIRISLDGILSHFWTANYWFRDSDGLFIRYEGANGFPGTPMTTMQLDGGV